MVVGAFPIAKLSVLLVKQISKPIANACKERAKNSPFFRTYVCMPPAQFYNWCEVKAKMWILNLGRPVNIPVLSQEMAIELGANLLGETVIFVIGAGLLVVEYSRQSKKESAKEAKRVEELNHITSTLTDLFFTVQHQQTQLKELERIMHSLGENKPISSAPPPKTEGSTPPPKSTDPLPTIKTVSHTRSFGGPITATPYPDKGLILQSLNYIQMDICNSFFKHSEEKETMPAATTVARDDSQSTSKYESAILSEALCNIENTFRSLF